MTTDDLERLLILERLHRIESKLGRIDHRLRRHHPRAQRVTDTSARDLAIGVRHVESIETMDVFTYWVGVMQKNGNVKLTAERRRCIQARLKDGYHVPEIKLAIDGCARSDFHMARGPYRGGRRYDDLTLILRNGSRLEGFRDFAQDTGSFDITRFL